MRLLTRPRWRWPATSALLLLAGVLGTGCSSGDDATNEDHRTGGTKQAAPTATTDLPADTELTKELGSAADSLTAAGCRFGRFEEEDAKHVDDAEDLKFDTFPPTSGTHFPDWGPYGIYDEQVDDGYVVHNLEHGGVVVWFGSDVDATIRTAVEDLADEDEKWMMMPRSDIAGLYSAAWTVGLHCPPAALTKLGPESTATALDTWYETVVSTGSEAEKNIPAYAGSMKEPTPENDISTPPPNE